MAPDSDSARAAFDAATDFTVGIEEEFALLDAGDLGLTSRFDELREAAAEDPVLCDSVAGELISSEIEIRSGRGEDLAAAIAAQRQRRRRLFALAQERGIALGATGTHPWSDYREQHIIQTDHYRRVEDGLKYVAWRNNTFSVHVHVGIQGADRAVLVCDRLRPVLPLLLAVSANSPFLDGRDSGLHSARTQTFTKSFPRCGVPDAFGSWDAFAQYIDFLVLTRSIVEYTQVWWSVRPHFSFGTVEVRICDAQATSAESDALAALIVDCVRAAARDHDAGTPFADPAPRLVEENMWRAIRYGMDGRLIDFGARGERATAATAREIEAREALERLATWAEHDLALPERNGAQRQRDLLAGGAGLPEVY